MKLHNESLVHIPLVKQMLSDPNVQFLKRAIDNNWKYSRNCPLVVSGFNPFDNNIYVSAISRIGEWLKKPSQSARNLNQQDELIYEVLFSVHDYLHCWAYRALASLSREFNIAHEDITVKNVESFIFCHLLTEAVASVGLDYWFLSQVDLNQIVPIGTKKIGLTVDFHCNMEKEFRQFNPNFKSLSPHFFNDILNLYLNGNLSGFHLNDVKQSPQLLQWLRREITYADTQRIYTRSWFHFLTGHPDHFSRSNLTSEVKSSESWKKQLIKKIGELTWEKVVGNQLFPFPALPKRSYKSINTTQSGLVDFRFFNLNTAGSDFWDFLKESIIHPDSHEFLFWQIVSKFKFEDFKPEEVRLIKKCLNPLDIESLKFILENKVPIKCLQQEPKFLFLLN